MGMTFQAFRGSSGAQIAFTILLATSIGDRKTQCTAHERGGRQRGKGWSKSLFLENKVVVNFNFNFQWSQKIRSIGPSVLELWLSLNLAVKEQNERVYKCDRSCNFFCPQIEKLKKTDPS